MREIKEREREREREREGERERKRESNPIYHCSGLQNHQTNTTSTPWLKFILSYVT